MQSLLTFLFAYALLCALGFIIMSNLYDVGAVRSLPNVKYKWLYYVLQFTWGLPFNLLGVCLAAFLYCCGKKPYKYGWNYCFECNVNFGLDLGIFFIAPCNGSTHTKNHEHGHAIQNIYFGPLCIGMVAIPSMIRFWVRSIASRIGRPPETNYDDAWFEGQATKTGTQFIDNL
jgi:hypothetical protein